MNEVDLINHLKNISFEDSNLDNSINLLNLCIGKLNGYKLSIDAKKQQGEHVNIIKSVFVIEMANRLAKLCEKKQWNAAKKEAYAIKSKGIQKIHNLKSIPFIKYKGCSTDEQINTYSICFQFGAKPIVVAWHGEYNSYDVYDGPSVREYNEEISDKSAIMLDDSHMHNKKGLDALKNVLNVQKTLSEFLRLLKKNNGLAQDYKVKLKYLFTDEKLLDAINEEIEIQKFDIKAHLRPEYLEELERKGKVPEDKLFIGCHLLKCFIMQKCDPDKSSIVEEYIGDLVKNSDLKDIPSYGKIGINIKIKQPEESFKELCKKTKADYNNLVWIMKYIEKVDFSKISCVDDVYNELIRQEDKENIVEEFCAKYGVDKSVLSNVLQGDVLEEARDNYNNNNNIDKLETMIFKAINIPKIQEILGKNASLEEVNNFFENVCKMFEKKVEMRNVSTFLEKVSQIVNGLKDKDKIQINIGEFILDYLEKFETQISESRLNTVVDKLNKKFTDIQDEKKSISEEELILYVEELNISKENVDFVLRELLDFAVSQEFNSSHLQGDDKVWITAIKDEHGTKGILKLRKRIKDSQKGEEYEGGGRY